MQRQPERVGEGISCVPSYRGWTFGQHWMRECLRNGRISLFEQVAPCCVALATAPRHCIFPAGRGVQKLRCALAECSRSGWWDIVEFRSPGKIRRTTEFEKLKRTQPMKM